MEKTTMPSQQKTGPGKAVERFILRTYPQIHVFLYRLTHGSVAGNFGERIFLLLTTTGRKSGKEYTTPLPYTLDNGRFIVIASNGGAATDPQWCLNLRAHPQAKVQIGEKTLAVTASEADAEERKRLWSNITSRFSNYEDYQKRTTREIPIVILTPNP
jgi:F420H(2)-dependent quinone reductase